LAIEYCVDRDKKLLVMNGSGVLTADDVLGYLKDVLSRNDLAGYDELLDLSRVDEIVLSTIGKMQLLAQIATGMAKGTEMTRLAIVAGNESTQGLGRMYETYQNLQGKGSKEVAVFSVREAALEFLNVDPATLNVAALANN
jgi:hypothetical protein